MARATTGYDRDGGLLLRRIRALVDDFVGGVEGDGGVCEGERIEGAVDEVGRIVDEMFCCEAICQSSLTILGVIVSLSVRDR